MSVLLSVGVLIGYCVMLAILVMLYLVAGLVLWGCVLAKDYYGIILVLLYCVSLTMVIFYLWGQ